MRNPKIWYGAQRYRSHWRTSVAYRRMLSRHYEFVKYPQDCDIAIIHAEPHDYRTLLSRLQIPRSAYLIGYCVWEASALPEAYAASLELVDEVWTCSRYCKEIFAPYHSLVTYIPHCIVRDTSFAEITLDRMKREIEHDASSFYFLTLGRLRDKRKNIEFMIQAFMKSFPERSSTRLIVKCDVGEKIPDRMASNIICLPMNLRGDEINALYSVSHAVVSAHHSEGWGLTLSDAFLMQKPVIATGYSGNLEFMNPHNSYLVKNKVSNISPNDCFGLFTSQMKWAYPNEDSLISNMRYIRNSNNAKDVEERCRRADTTVAAFSPDAIDSILYGRIEEIAASL